ncbi:hypothetical protein [Streptomyces triculaminicus]|uniref:hypothetical protein n=1 Tax=Streptomyces triculaminicus TaxID=2816232 RepID=UPI0037B8407B
MTDMKTLTGSGHDDMYAALVGLASDYRQWIDDCRARERREQDERERRVAVERVATYMTYRFDNTLGKVLPADAWQGYPGEHDLDRQPMAVAYLGAGTFLIHTAEPRDDGSDKLDDSLILLCPCPCGAYIETWIETEYDFAFALDELQHVAACETTCTASGWSDPWGR